jgi:hypothetical protein
MPASASLANAANTVAFTVPAGARGYVFWNSANATLFLREGQVSAASGAAQGRPVLPGNTTTQFVTREFLKPLREPLPIHIFQSSGGAITATGYEILFH